MHVDILTENRWSYTQENYLAEQVKRGFDALGVKWRHIALSDGTFGSYLLNEDRPDWTLAFKDPIKQQTPICELMRIPHFQWEHQSLAGVVHHLEASYSHVAFTDRGVDGVHFLPHGVDPDLKGEKERIFDVVLFNDLIDTQNKIQTWHELFCKQGVKLLEQGVVSCANKFPVKHLIGQKPDVLSLNDLVHGVEEYLRAEKVCELVCTLKGGHLFGEHIGNNWLVRLNNRVSLHAKLPYIEHFEVLKMSRILVREQWPGSDGSDEWLLPALQVGCLVLTNPTPYLEELVGKESEIFYPEGDWKGLQERIDFFLAHPEKAKLIIEELQEKCVESHSWNRQVQEVLNLMEQA